jgi:hypothetical protein
MLTPEENRFLMRLAEMYGDDAAKHSFKQRLGKDAPDIKREESFIDLNNL